MPSLETSLHLTIGNSQSAEEHAIPLIVDYTVEGSEVILDELTVRHRGMFGAVKLSPISDDWLWGLIEDDQSILDECMADHRDREEYARESHYDALREERMLSKAEGK